MWATLSNHAGYRLILNVAIGGQFPAALGGGPTPATRPGAADARRLREDRVSRLRSEPESVGHSERIPHGSVAHTHVTDISVTVTHADRRPVSLGDPLRLLA